MDSRLTAGERSLSPSEFASTARNSANARESNAGRDQSATRRALYATVRLRVEDPDGNSFGTGTIIDTLAASVDRDLRPSVSRFAARTNHDRHVLPGGPQQVPGVLIAYDADQRDIALVAFKPGVPIEPMPVAPSGYAARPGDRVFSLGCDRGQDASVRESHVTAVDKYMNAPNIEVAGMPVDGRSGGGLFTADGQLIGVRNAADPADNEGIMLRCRRFIGGWIKAGCRTSIAARNRLREPPPPGCANPAPAESSFSVNARSIVWLSMNGTSRGEWRRSTSLPRLVANACQRRRRPERLGDSRFDPRFDAGFESRAMTGGEFTTAASAQPDRAFEFASPTAGDLQAEEVICIVRSRSNPNDRRMIVVEQPSAELLGRLSAESRQSAAAAELANRYREQEIMRAQSADR
ncbi:MAG: serine protease [Pirellulaceae bacterium]